MALYDSNGNLLASDDDSGYGLNSLISYYFNANVEYIVRVHFYSSSQVGKIKFTVTPARGALNSGASSIQKYEDIYSVKSYTGYTWSTYLEPNYTKAITFTPPSSGDYTFEITSNLDTYIYVIDPRSTEWIIIDVNYNDDAGEGNNAKLTTALEANVPYLVIYSTYNLTSLSQSTYITLNISKN